MSHSTPHIIRVIFPVTHVDLGPLRRRGWQKMLWWWAVVPAFVNLTLNTHPGTVSRSFAWLIFFSLLAWAGERFTVVPNWVRRSDWKLWHVERGSVKPLPEDVRYTFREVIAVHQDMHLHARVRVTNFLPQTSLWIRLRFEAAPDEETVRLLLKMREELLQSSTLSLEAMQGSASLPSYVDPGVAST